MQVPGALMPAKGVPAQPFQASVSTAVSRAIGQASAQSVALVDLSEPLAKDQGPGMGMGAVGENSRSRAYLREFSQGFVDLA